MLASDGRTNTSGKHFSVIPDASTILNTRRYGNERSAPKTSVASPLEMTLTVETAPVGKNTSTSADGSRVKLNNPSGLRIS
ncbi:MAG: hypothetical protein WCG02_03970 [Candidatus Taylorbacteria bacterium]